MERLTDKKTDFTNSVCCQLRHEILALAAIARGLANAFETLSVIAIQAQERTLAMPSQNDKDQTELLEMIGY